MDSFVMIVSGHIGKVQGIGRDRYKRDVYRFSVATNFRLPDTVLWLQCTVINQSLFQLCIERGLLKGDHVLVMCDRADVRAAADGKQLKAWLNVEVAQMTFLTAPAIPQMERMPEYTDRIINFDELMKTG